MNSAFVIVKTFEGVYRDFERRTPAGTNMYSIPQQGVDASAVGKKYRGLDRDPLTATDLKLMAKMIRMNPQMYPVAERAACLALAHLEEEGKTDGCLVYSLQDTSNVYTTLGNAADWEVVWARVENADVESPPQMSLLGFEPNYFPEGYFSPLCDCMCFPRWHGTDKEGTLFKEYHARLNSHGLFDSTVDAINFLSFYRSFDWTEKGEYSIVSIWALSQRLHAQLTQPPRSAVLGDHEQERLFGTTLPGMTWKLYLRSHARTSNIVAMAAIDDITGMGIVEAKALVETLPKTIVVVYAGEVELLESTLANAGFVVDIVPFI